MDRIYCNSCSHWKASGYTVNEADGVIPLGHCHRHPVKIRVRADHFCGEIQMTAAAARKHR